MQAKAKMYLFGALSTISLLAVLYLCLHWSLFVAIGKAEGETASEAKNNATLIVLLVGFLPIITFVVFGKLAFSNRKKLK